MTTSFHFSDPSDLEVEFTINMTVGELRKLREQLKSLPVVWPAQGFWNAMNDTLQKVDQTITQTPSKEKA